MRNFVLFVLTWIAAGLCLGAEVYPSKPVRVVVAFSPGGTTDLVARVISQQLTEQFGKSFLVDNRPGAGGNVGYGYAAKSTPDGYTLLMVDAGFSIVPSLYKSLPYDVLRDFTPITQVARAPFVLVVVPSFKANTLQELIALVRANPGKFNYGSSGTGGADHLFSELFKMAAKVNLVHVPYKGAGDERAALLAGQEIQMAISSIPTAVPFVKSGQLRALAVTTDGKRVATLPDVPSMSEAGVPGMTIYAWSGLVGPVGITDEVVGRVHAEVVKAIAVPTVKDPLIAQGAELLGSAPGEFSRHIRSELQRWAEVIKAARISIE